MTTNKILMTKARESISGQWGLVILSFLVSGLLASVGGPIGLAIGGAIQLGITIFSLNIARRNKIEFQQIFEGFNRFVESLVAYLLMLLFILLWSLLFIIPGIIAAISYSQTFFILADDKKITGVDALKKSKKMMIGHKWKYFCLGFRFFGWFILSILTMGIGFLWLIPYFSVSFANFYEDIKD